MYRPLLAWLSGLALFLAGTIGHAESVVVEGAAPLRNQNPLAAREEAIRNALAEAARSGSLHVGSVLGTSGPQTAFDQVVVKASARVYRHQIINESHDGETYRVTLSADLESEPASPTGNVCREGHTKRLLIGGFPVLRPEQLKSNEMSGYAQLSAGEIARRLGANPAIFADYNGSTMVHFGVPERVVGAIPLDLQAWSVVRAATRKHRAQYLLIGRYRSLSISADESHREIDMEALILDASDGSCVARKRFSQTASGHVAIPESIVFGSTAHYASDFGRVHGAVLEDVARWAEAITSCLPFSARVVKVDNKAVYLDAGAEQGVSIGDTFSAFKSARQPITTPRGEILGIEKRAVGELVITTVYPRFAIGELTTPPSAGLALEPDDELFGR